MTFVEDEPTATLKWVESAGPRAPALAGRGIRQTLKLAADWRLNLVYGENAQALAAKQTYPDGKVDRVQSLLYNALEPAVDALFPDMLQIREILRAFGLRKPMVSGSGSVVFSVCATEEEAGRAMELLEGKQFPGWRLFLSTTQV